MYPDNRISSTRVLIADEDAVTRHWLASILSGEGFDVVAVSDGREAYRVLQSDANFKGAIFDSSLPHLDGPDLIRHMHTEKRLIRIPVMMITSETNLKLLADVLAAGATVLLSKPFSRSGLQNALRLMLRTQDPSDSRNGAKPSRRQPYPRLAEKPNPNKGNQSREMNDAVPAIDMRVLMDLGADDQNGDLVMELIDVYLASARDAVKKINSAVKSEPSLMKDRIRALKGSSATIGAGRVARVCELLQGLSETTPKAKVRELLKQLDREYLAAQRALIGARSHKFESVCA